MADNSPLEQFKQVLTGTSRAITTLGPLWSVVSASFSVACMVLTS